MKTIKLIVGLGNPGAKHERDRHNAGFWFVDEFARAHGGVFGKESRFQGDACQTNVAHRPVRLLKPTTFMNRSGQSVRAMADYYRIAPEEVLVVHDELDLPPGTARLKFAGGHGGHNGLRDLISHMGRDFFRLRIGVGHPGDRNRVVGFVLQPPTSAEAKLIDDALRESLSAVEVFLREGEQKAMSQLHSRANAPKPTPPGSGGKGGNGARGGEDTGGDGARGGDGPRGSKGAGGGGTGSAEKAGPGARGVGRPVQGERDTACDDPEARRRGAQEQQQ